MAAAVRVEEEFARQVQLRTGAAKTELVAPDT
jgi:hypothetical protein